MTIKILSAIACALLIWCIAVQQAKSPTCSYTPGKIEGPIYVKPQPTLSSRSSKPPVKQIYEITAYTMGPESTGKHPGDPGYGITASGEKIQVGDCAADETIPFGTRVFIDGLGEYRVADRGGSVGKNHIDVYVADFQKAIKFGRQYREVTIIPGN